MNLVASHLVRAHPAQLFSAPAAILEAKEQFRAEVLRSGVVEGKMDCHILYMVHRA